MRLPAVKNYIGAIDQGTTSTRFMVFDQSARVVAVAQKEHEQIFSKPGWVEHDPLEILRRTEEVIADALGQRGLRASDLAAIGITNQRETTALWERRTGKPVANAIVWQDTRVAEEVGRFAKEGGQDRFRAQTGLPLSTYFSSLKLRWLLQNVPGAREKAAAGELLFGNIDTFLLWNLTGGSESGVHITDVTNASLTQLLNLKTLDWDAGLLAAFDIPRAVLPQVRSSSEIYGEASLKTIAGVRFTGILGDQQAALVGQACFRPGEVKNTYGTGCFLLMNTGERLVPSNFGLLTTVAYKFGGGPAHYALEGGVAIAGALVQWLRDNLGIIAGLTRYANKGHLARAVLEATAFQTREVVEAMEKDSQIGLKSLRVDGGMVNNELLMQFQADILNREVVRPLIQETTALGAAYAAGLAVGFFSGLEELRANWAVDRTWKPRLAETEREQLYRHWKKAVTRSFEWIES